MAKYLLAVHHDYDAPPPPPEQMQRAFDQVDAFNQDLMSKEVWVFGGGLLPPDMAAVTRGIEATTTDGPYAESKEHLGGFWVIEAQDLDAALDWANRATAACMNPVEVQPLADFSDVPPTSEGRPQFLLSVRVGGDAPAPQMTPEQQQASWQQMQQLEADMQASGTWQYSARLAGPDTATVVTSRDGEVLLTDGPFAESKEHLGGFYVIAADDRQAALEWGHRVSSCIHMPIEVRPFETGGE